MDGFAPYKSAYHVVPGERHSYALFLLKGPMACFLNNTTIHCTLGSYVGSLGAHMGCWILRAHMVWKQAIGCCARLVMLCSTCGGCLPAQLELCIVGNMVA